MLYYNLHAYILVLSIDLSVCLLHDNFQNTLPRKFIFAMQVHLPKVQVSSYINVTAIKVKSHEQNNGQSNLAKAALNPFLTRHGGIGTRITMSFGFPGISTPNKTSIHSAVFAQPTHVTDIRQDHQSNTCILCIQCDPESQSYTGSNNSENQQRDKQTSSTRAVGPRHKN